MKRKLLIFALSFCTLFSMLAYFPQNSALAAETQGVVSSYVIYNIQAVHSQKNLDVYYGTDANGTNVIQYTPDGSNAQKFRLVYDSGSDSYYIKAYCSSQGYNRHLDVYSTPSVPIANGSNVHIWEPGDANASQWKIIGVGDGKYKIVLRYNQNLALTVAGGSTANGTGTGKSSTSPGNVIVATYTGASYQQWKLNFVSADPAPNITNNAIYFIKNKKSGLYIQPVNENAQAGNNLEQKAFTGNLAQQWKIERNSNGTYKLRCMGGNEDVMLSGLSGYEYDGGYMCMWYDNPSDYRNYVIAPASSGAYKILIQQSNFVRGLAIQNGSTSSGAYVVQSNYTHNSDYTDEWVLEKCNNFYFNPSSYNQLKNGFINLLGSGKYHLDCFYNTTEALDIVLDNDLTVTYISNLYKMPKAMIQAILFREIWCYRSLDYVVESYVNQYYIYKRQLEWYYSLPLYLQLITPEPEAPDFLLSDCSTGLGQIFASTAIDANNYAINENIIVGLHYNENDWHDMDYIWNSLEEDGDFNLGWV